MTGVGTAQPNATSASGGTHLLAASPKDAERVASARGMKLTNFFALSLKVPPTAKKCTWQVGTTAGLTIADRAAIAWIVADAAMKQRSGGSNVYTTWRSAALNGVKLTGNEHRRVAAFVDAVFGLPPHGKSEDHLIGHVAEWMWFLHTSEIVDPTRTPVVLEAPKFNVTEPGADGFIVFHDTATDEHHYRLWELKKHTASGPVSATVTSAYNQLDQKAMRYLAQQVSIHSTTAGPIGELCSQLVDFWLECHDRAGVGVGVTTASAPPSTCFTTMGKRFPGFDKPGQLEGLLISVEDLAEIAKDVRGYLWTVL